MGNIIETALTDVEKVVEWPFKELGTANKIIGAALKDSPALQAAVTGMVSKVEQLATDASAAVAGDGLNFDADAAAIAQAKELYSYTTGTFIPAVQSAIKDIEAAAANAPSSAAKAAPKKTAASTKTPSAAAPSTTAASTDAPAVTED